MAYSARFEVTGIPSLIVVNRSGDTEGTADRNIVQQQRENNVYKEKTQMCGVHLWLDQDKKEPIENQERRTSIKASVYYTGLKPNSHKAKKAKPEFLKTNDPSGERTPNLYCVKKPKSFGCGLEIPQYDLLKAVQEEKVPGSILTTRSPAATMAATIRTWPLPNGTTN